MPDDIHNIHINPVDRIEREAFRDPVAGFFLAHAGDVDSCDGDDFNDAGHFAFDGTKPEIENEDFAPTIYFDPARFPHPDDLENLESLIRGRRPADEQRDWRYVRLNRDILRTWSPFATSRAEMRFVARGYVTELECRDDNTRENGLTDQHRAAVDALHHASVTAEIIIECVQNIMGDRRPAWLTQSAREILEPLLGRMAFAIGGGRASVREVPLTEAGGLLLGCRNFDIARRVFFADKCSFEQAKRYGREGFLRFSEIDHDEYRTIVHAELAIGDVFGRPVDLPGIALWACQQVARLRLAAGDALLRTSKAWANGDREAAIANHRHLMATRIQNGYHDEMPEFETPAIDLMSQSSVHIVETAFADSWNVIEGESEADPDRTLRAIATWAAGLRRWGFANLDRDIAHSLVALIQHGDQVYAECFESIDGKAAIERLKHFLPPLLWEQIEDAASQVIADGRSIGVIYDWNNPPLRVEAVVETGRAPIIGRGPLLTFPTYENDRWARLAQTVGPQGLVIG